MSSKKPTVSEIRALEQKFRDAHFSCDARIHVPHLLDLVKRLGKTLERHGRHLAICDYVHRPCDCGWEEARALLLEIKE
jgi:hypothetical protein